MHPTRKLKKDAPPSLPLLVSGAAVRSVDTEKKLNKTGVSSVIPAPTQHRSNVSTAARAGRAVSRANKKPLPRGMNGRAKAAYFNSVD
jgi:hypothetical protein